MARTWSNISKRMLFVYLMLIGLIFCFLLPPWMTGNLQLMYASLFRVPLAFGRTVTLGVRTAATAQDPLARENERLRTANQLLENRCANLKAELQTARSRIDELAGLRTNPEWSGLAFLQAGVMTDPAPGQSELLIARGREDGVAVDQYVMAELSIIGTISAVSAKTARVRLITDPGSSLPVRIEGGSVRGIMEGRGGGTAGITKVPVTEPVKVGSTVRASRIPGAPGLSIIAAKVTGCKRAAKEPLVWDISVRPVCDIINLNSVIVIVPRK
jgi:rod shape-determining protein MreC